MAARYQQVLAEWKACEVVVRQREREAHPATLTKFSSGSSIDSHVQRLVHRDSTISNDVSQTEGRAWWGVLMGPTNLSGTRFLSMGPSSNTGSWVLGRGFRCQCLKISTKERATSGTFTPINKPLLVLLLNSRGKWVSWNLG